MKYIVSISYIKFEFTDGEQAMEFANTAMEHGYKENLGVEITLNDVKEESEDDE